MIMASLSTSRRRFRPAAAVVVGICFLLSIPSTNGFQLASTTTRGIPSPQSPLTHPESNSKQMGFRSGNNNHWRQSPAKGGVSSTSLNSFMGSDGGLFGIGTPELVRDALGAASCVLPCRF